MRYVALALLTACSGGGTEPAEPLDVALLTGAYTVALRSTSDLNHNNSCPSLTLDFDAGTFTCTLGAWNGVTGALHRPGDGVQLYVGTSEEWTFSEFTGSANAPRGRWIGPCTQAIGSGPGCYREGGRATFSRP